MMMGASHPQRRIFFQLKVVGWFLRGCQRRYSVQITPQVQKYMAICVHLSMKRTCFKGISGMGIRQTTQMVAMQMHERGYLLMCGRMYFIFL
jgi:hypothetical protein